MRIVLPACLFMVLAASCQERTAEETPPLLAQAGENQGELPSLARVGGAQDVWPFEFGMDSDRDEVQTVLGAPDSSTERAAGDSGAIVVRWSFPTADLSFFVDENQGVEYLVSARFSEPKQLQSGLSVGMPVEEALEILGEPGYEDGDMLVFFYYTTTIELATQGDTVREIVLARALP